MDTITLCVLTVLLQSTWKVGLSSSPASYIADQLLLLKPGERERFAERCFQRGVCSREDLNSFVWSSEHAKARGEERFWYSYQCALIKKQDDCPVDGGWGSWGPWGTCEHGCGVSLASRFRNCTHPAPLRGGFQCDGLASQITNCESLTECKVEGVDTTNAVERARLVLQTFHKQEPELEMMCLRSRCSYQQIVDVITPSHLAEEYWSNLQCLRYLRGCPVDGGWSEWNSWGECSSRCGEGKSFRRRQCNSPEPRSGGASCDGSTIGEGPCLDHSCADIVGVTLSSWSQWTECAVTCGDGVISSTRTCHGAETCDILKGERVSSLVRTAPCILEPCDRKGEWADWKDWTVCTALCGNGTRYRLRECNNPAPIGDDNNCEGEGYEKQGCRHWESFCEENEATNQQQSEWNAWSQCSSPCKGGFSIRHRYCIGQTEEHCYGSLYDMEACNSEIPCPLDGGFSEWSEWSPCSVTCGDGINDRYRICNNPYPQFDGNSCEGKSQQIQTCERLQCPTNLTSWGDWGSWRVCSQDCGGGVVDRSRDCIHHGEILPRSSCGGEFEQVSVCNYQQCSVDGNWAAWSEWNECTESCGEGIKIRDRTCTDPAPAGNGVACEGLGTEIEHCSKIPCPTHRVSVYQFDGSSFISYRRLARPTKHVLLYISFFPTTVDGLLLLKREEEGNDVFLVVKLFQNRVFLNAKGGEAEVNVESGIVEISTWNHVEVGVSGNQGWLRINDGVTNTTEFSNTLPYDIDWDIPLHVGGALPHLLSDIPGPNVGGMNGKISDVRTNYRELRLSSEIEEWNGAGVPYVTLNVGEEVADVESQLTIFRGSSYMIVPIHIEYTFPLRPIVISVKFKLLGENGLLLYNVGEEPGSHLAVLIRNCVPVLNIDFGGDLVETNGGVIQLHHWVVLDIMIDGPTVEIRVDKGPAGQVSSPYENVLYRPMKTMSVGGASLTDMPVVTMALGVSHGFHGYVFSTVVNGQLALSEENAIESPNKTVNSASSTISGHYQEIREPKGSSVVLRCNYQNLIQTHDVATADIAKQSLRWLRGDTILEVGDNMKIESDYSLTSNLHLHDLDEDLVGLYACLVNLDGRSLISQAFGISVFDSEYYDFDPDIVDDVLIIASVSLFGLLVLAIIIASFIPSLRKRFSLFKNVNTIFTSCWRLPRRLAKRKAGAENGKSTALLAEINSTYDTFVERVEKAKERAKAGAKVPHGLLDEIDDTYEEFLDRVRLARNFPDIDKTHLQEINSTYDKFMKRMDQSKTKDVLKEINETYGQFKEKEFKGKTRSALMSEIRDESHSPRRTGNHSSRKTGNHSSRRAEELLNAKVLEDINNTYDNFNIKQSREERKASLMNEVKQTRGRSQKRKQMKEQVNAVLEEVGHTYETFKQREDASLKRKDLINEISVTYEEFKSREEGAKRRKSLMKDVKGTKGRSQKSKQIKKQVNAVLEDVGHKYEDFKQREDISIKKKDVVGQVHDTYEEFKSREEQAKRRVSLLKDVKGTKGRSQKSKSIKQHISAVVDDVGKTYAQFKERERQSIQGENPTRGMNSERRRKSAPKSLLSDIDRTYDSFKEREHNESRRATLMNELLTQSPSIPTYVNQDEELDQETLKQRKRISRKKASVMKEVAALYDITQDREKRKMLKGMLMREIEDTYDDFQDKASPANMARAVSKRVSFSSTPTGTSHDTERHEYDDEFSDFTDDDFSSDDLLSDIDEYESINDNPQFEDDGIEETEQNTNSSNSGAMPTLAPRRLSVKELAEKLNTSLTFGQTTTPNMNSLTTIPEISLPGTSEDTTDTLLPIPPPPPPPPQDFFTNSTQPQDQSDYDISHLTPYITSSTELTHLEDDEDGNISSNNSNKVADSQLSQSASNMGTNQEN